MKVLTFKLNYADKRWNDYLESLLGKEEAEKCLVESRTTKEIQDAKVNILNFDGNSKTINVLKADNNVTSAYIVENNSVRKVIKKD